MNESKKIFYLILAIFSIMIVPYLGAYIHLDGKFDQHYFQFPPVEPERVFDDFSWAVFIGVAIVFVITILFYLLPNLFGFKKTALTSPPKEIKKEVPYPIWFWAGLVVWLGSLLFLMTHQTSPKLFLHWAYVPLFWGFVFMLDGIVFKRTKGKSIYNNNPQELVGIAVSSIGGWLMFEFLNFFVLEYWYYPEGDKVPPYEFYTYAIFASSALFPLAFEWYSFFLSFPKLATKYKQGPKITASKTFKIILLVLAYIGLFLMSFFPTYLAPVIWVSPLVILTATLSLLGVWTPFAPIKSGNWTVVVLMALTYLIGGFFLEGQNYLSATHIDGQPFTEYPGFWVYNVPFVNRFHVFEMPLVGYYGYLPFGIYCMVWWIAFAYLLNIRTYFEKFEKSAF